MIKITKPEDLKPIEHTGVYTYVQNLLQDLLNEYQQFCPDSSIETIGAIFVLERESDWEQYKEMGLFDPITHYDCFEWIQTIENSYCNGCIIIHTDYAINIIGKQEYFIKFKEAIQ